MQAFACAAAGFLLAVLWFDLMHDVAWRTDLDGVIRYYRRVTTDAAPMNLLVLVAMLGLVAALLAELVGSSVPSWAAITSLVLAVPPIALSRRTVRAARSLSTPAGARSILRDHLFCFPCIAGVLVVQLASLA